MGENIKRLLVEAINVNLSPIRVYNAGTDLVLTCDKFLLVTFLHFHTCPL